METKELINKIIERAKFFESYSEKPYPDSVGKLTIGYGYNYQDNGLPSGLPTSMSTTLFEKGFTKELAEYLVRRHVESAYGSATQFKFFNTLTDARKGVIVDMIFQLGLGGFQNFRRTIANLAAGNFDAAAAEMKDSKWFVQSARRGRSNVDQMIKNIWIQYEK